MLNLRDFKTQNLTLKCFLVERPINHWRFAYSFFVSFIFLLVFLILIIFSELYITIDEIVSGNMHDQIVLNITVIKSSRIWTIHVWQCKILKDLAAQLWISTMLWLEQNVSIYVETCTKNKKNGPIKQAPIQEDKEDLRGSPLRSTSTARGEISTKWRRTRSDESIMICHLYPILPKKKKSTKTSSFAFKKPSHITFTRYP